MFTRVIPVFMFVCLIVPLSGNCSRQPDAGKPEASSSPGDHQAAADSGSRKLALLVGIDTYKHSDVISPLAGCVNDVEDMRALLIGKYNFEPRNIVMLKNEQATHAAIVKAIADHLGTAQPDDIVVFHFSAHGSQMKDVSGDEVDGLDETLVPYDSRDKEGKVFDISDDEINGLMQSLKSQHATLIFDACHSGTAARAAGRMRSAPRDERQPPVPGIASTTAVAQGTNDLRPDTARYVLISGCRSTESSFEHQADGKERGALTYFLAKELRAAGTATTYRDIMDRVKGGVNAEYPNQNPQLEGTELDTYVFGDSSSLSQPYISVSPLTGTSVFLDAGQVQGMTVGSVFDIFKSGTKQFAPPEQPIGKIRLTKVDVFSSEGLLTSGGHVERFSRAVERQHSYADRKLLVYYERLGSSPTMKSVKNVLDGDGFVTAVAEARNYHVLMRELNGRIVLEGPDTSLLSPPVAVTETGAVTHIVDQVRKWARWFNILSIDNPVASVKVTFSIRAVSGGESRDPFAHIDRDNAVLFENDRIEATVENNSDRPLFLSILDLATDGSVGLIFPSPPGAGEILNPGGKVTRRFRLSVSAGRQEVRDILKLFATSAQVDFKFLSQSGVKAALPVGGPDMNDPLGKLLRQAMLDGARDVVPDAVPLGDWVTAQRVLRVRKQ